MASPTLSSAPAAEQLAAIDCPVERARQVGVLARRFRTLPKSLSDVRKNALIQARITYRADWLAAELDLSPGRISQLTGRISRRAPALEGATS